MRLSCHYRKIVRCRLWLVPGLAILLLITLATGLSAQPPIAPEEVARAWLKLVDGGQSANSWEQTGSPFKARSSEQAWQTMLNYIRRSVGPVESRKIASVQFSNSLLGAPDGEYALVRFNSAFVHKSSTLETLSLGSENNHWVVIGYFIK